MNKSITLKEGSCKLRKLASQAYNYRVMSLLQYSREITGNPRLTGHTPNNIVKISSLE